MHRFMFYLHLLGKLKPPHTGTLNYLIPHLLHKPVPINSKQLLVPYTNALQISITKDEA